MDAIYIPQNNKTINKNAKKAMISIVVVRLHWFDVGDRLQNTHRGDPSVTLLDDIPGLPRASLFIDESIKKPIAPR